MQFYIEKYVYLAMATSYRACIEVLRCVCVCVCARQGVACEWVYCVCVCVCVCVIDHAQKFVERS